MKEKCYKIVQYPRGVNKGGILKTELCPTITINSWQCNCFLLEYYKEIEKGEGE